MKNALYWTGILLTMLGMMWRKAALTANVDQLAPSPIISTSSVNTSIGKKKMSEYRTDWLYAILRFDRLRPKGAIEHLTDNLEEASKYMTALREKGKEESTEFHRLGSRFELFERISV